MWSESFSVHKLNRCTKPEEFESNKFISQKFQEYKLRFSFLHK